MCGARGPGRGWVLEERVRGQESGVVCKEEEQEATLCQLGAHTLHGGVDLEDVRVCWDGLGTVLCDQHHITSTYCFTGVSLF